jgi:hypothetical protein
MDAAPEGPVESRMQAGEKRHRFETIDFVYLKV